MNTAAVIITAGADLATVIVSICMSVFVAGSKWGRVETKIEYMSDRLAKIEGMFTLRVRNDGSDRSDIHPH